MSKSFKQAGFSAVEIVIVIVILVIVSYLGYVFYTNYMSQNAADSSSAITQVQDAPTITSEDDLDKASAAMDEAQLDKANTDDLSELDGAMAEL